MRIIFALTLMLVSSPTVAEEWVVVRESPESSGPPGMLVDSTSITILDGGLRRAKIKTDWLSRKPEIQALGGKVLSFVITVRLYDCQKQLTQTESVETHQNDGSFHGPMAYKDTKWYPWPENRAADPAIDFVCGWKPV